MEKEKFWSIPLSEQETTISFNRDQQEVDIWTNDRTMITKLDNLCKSNPSTYICKETGRNSIGEVMDKRYKITDKTLLSFRTKKKIVELTDEQKAERAERLRRNTGRTS